MTQHIWGDEWFEKNGGDLDNAGTWIAKQVHKATGKPCSWKEKYGTLRYEFIDYSDPKYCKALHAAIEKATKKWPHIKDELLEDSPFDDQSGPYWDDFY